MFSPPSAIKNLVFKIIDFTVDKFKNLINRAEMLVPIVSGEENGIGETTLFPFKLMILRKA